MTLSPFRRGMTVYAVEFGAYGNRQTEMLFTSEALAQQYVAARKAAARESDAAPMPDWYYDEWEIVAYPLRDVVPNLPDSLSKYDDVDEALA